MIDFEYERDRMKFPGYWVLTYTGKVLLKRATLDEAELDPATNWKQAWQNQVDESLVKGYVELEDALISVATSLAKAEGRIHGPAETGQAIRCSPDWHGDQCEIQLLSEVLGSNISRSTAYSAIKK